MGEVKVSRGSVWGWLGVAFRRLLDVVSGRGLRRRARHLALGRLGERLSCRALGEIGVEVLCRNYRNRRGEIDIVAREGGVLCFVEVKSRRVGGRARPADAVDAERRLRYVRAAGLYLRSVCPEGALAHRYDIMEVEFRGWRVCGMRYGRGAFTGRGVLSSWRRRRASGL